MAALLLARAGVDVLVLEKHGDFLRDFRGDTVHPSTLELIHELGVLDAFLARPHQELTSVGAEIGGDRVTIGDFSHLPTTCRFIALMPQWEFLDFLVGQARRYPTFRLMMNAEVVDVIADDTRVTGVRVRTDGGERTIRSELTIGADGRRSIVREKAGLSIETLGAPIDVLWMRLPRRPSDREQTLGYVHPPHVLVMLDRGDYWQCALVIRKGAYESLQRDGLEAFRARVAAIVPFVADRVGELRSWDDVKLLTVMVDRLKAWSRPGLLCIGDAAHAMSPIGGVGINLAIQDAVAAANLLHRPLLSGDLSPRDLQRVQRRRLWPTRLTQRAQVLIQNRVLSRALESRGPVSLPLALRLLRDHPILRRIPARLVGLGVRPEHIATPDAFATL
jgi:2-polyprenyl-6-methoxyphenol hydroxylase-like FAD-dependent oxidoreductase